MYPQEVLQKRILKATTNDIIVRSAETSLKSPLKSIETGARARIAVKQEVKKSLSLNDIWAKRNRDSDQSAARSLQMYSAK